MVTSAPNMSPQHPPSSQSNQPSHPLQTPLNLAKQITQNRAKPSDTPAEPRSLMQLRKSTARLGSPQHTAPPLRKPKYKTNVVSLTPPDLAAVTMPMFYPRDGNQQHIDQLKLSILHEGIDDEIGFIAFFAHLGTRQVVRGAQLLQSFNELYEQGRIRYVVHDSSTPTPQEQHQVARLVEGVLHIDKIKCIMLDRVDDNGATSEAPFTATETLLLAAHYNSKNGHVRPMTMLDNITLAQRFILCRLRDLSLYEHVQLATRRSTPPNVIWSRLQQFVTEATSCNLISYSTTPSAPVHLDAIATDFTNTSDTSAAADLLAKQIRSSRQRQTEYLRLAMSLLWSPNTQNLIMNRYHFDRKPITCALWSLRTFQLRPFTSANDTVQFVLLMALYRAHQERRSLKLYTFNRDNTKQFIDVVEQCLKKLLSWGMNRTKDPPPTMWDILNGVTTTTGTAIETNVAASPRQQTAESSEQNSAVTVASILMSLLTRWEHVGPKSVSMPSPQACTTNDVLFSLQCVMNRWPFEKNWRTLSPSLPCFQQDLFLQPILPLHSIRFWPTQPPPNTAAPSPRNENSAIPPASSPPETMSAAQSMPRRPTTRSKKPVVLMELLLWQLRLPLVIRFHRHPSD